METKIKHILNSLHMYCRLRELGIRKKNSMKIVSFYYEKIYKVVFERKKNGQGNT